MEWINVKDKLPKQDEQVLVYAKDFDKVTIGIRPDDDTSDDIWGTLEDSDPYNERGCSFDVTHWMPLPAKPMR